MDDSGYMTGEELGQKLLAAAQEMAADKGRVVFSPAIDVCRGNSPVAALVSGQARGPAPTRDGVIV